MILTRYQINALGYQFDLTILYLLIQCNSKMASISKRITTPPFASKCLKKIVHPVYGVNFYTVYTNVISL